MGRSVDEPAANLLASCTATLGAVLDRRAQPPTAAGPAITRLDIGLPPGGVLVDQPAALRRVPRLAWWDHFVIRQTARRWRKLAGPADAGPLIAYVFHPKFWPYVKDLAADYLVYHAYDL